MISTIQVAQGIIGASLSLAFPFLPSLVSCLAWLRFSFVVVVVVRVCVRGVREGAKSERERERRK